MNKIFFCFNNESLTKILYKSLIKKFNDSLKINSVRIKNTKKMNKESNLRIYEMLTALFVTISKG